MSRRIDSKVAIRSFLLLGISRIPRGEREHKEERDEAATCLARDIRALTAMGKLPCVSLENLDEASLLPTRIANVVRYNKRFGSTEKDAFLFQDISLIKGSDFQSFRGLKHIGEHYTMVLHSIQDIYLETGRFRNLPKLGSLPIGEIGESEQEALITRVTECIRCDPAVRGALFQMFPPRTPKP